MLLMNIHQLAGIQFLLNSEFYKASWFIRWFFSTLYSPFWELCYSVCFTTRIRKSSSILCSTSHLTFSQSTLQGIKIVPGNLSKGSRKQKNIQVEIRFPATSSTSKNNKHVAQMEFFRKLSA